MSSRISRISFGLPAAKAEAIAEVCLTGGPEVSAVAGRGLLGQLRLRICSDEELAAELQSGNADALTEIFRRHCGLVFAIARRVLGDAADAEDATQRVFFDVYKAIGQFDTEKGAFKAWLLMFAYHRAFNFRRALIARRHPETDSFDDASAARLPANEQQRGFLQAEGRIFVEQALKSLPERQRRTIELVYFSGLTAEEVSAHTGETVRVVRHNLYRGLEKLRRTMCGPAGGTDANGRRR